MDMIDWREVEELLGHSIPDSHRELIEMGLELLREDVIENLKAEDLPTSEEIVTAALISTIWRKLEKLT